MQLNKKGTILFSAASLAFSFFLLAAAHANASEVRLQNVPDYYWYYGCSPTSAGMMMAYYDINGYGGLRYDNLVPGGTAELSTYNNPGVIANNIIASSGHIQDFYSSAPYNGSGTGLGIEHDDLQTINPTYVNHPFNSLADFMGTSQDSVENKNGGTTFYADSLGSKTTATMIRLDGKASLDGMYGLYEYFTYAGYSISEGAFFTRITDNQNSRGFTFANYKAEIDAGRVVIIQLVGHSMLGYGYDDEALGTDKIFFHDTWGEGEHSMDWGGSYGGMALWGITGFTPSGGTPVPVPAPVILLGSGVVLIFHLKKKRGQENAQPLFLLPDRPDRDDLLSVDM